MEDKGSNYPKISWSPKDKQKTKRNRVQKQTVLIGFFKWTTRSSNYRKGRFYDTLRNTAKNFELEQSCSGI